MKPQDAIDQYRRDCQTAQAISELRSGTNSRRRQLARLKRLVSDAHRGDCVRLAKTIAGLARDTGHLLDQVDPRWRDDPTRTIDAAEMALVVVRARTRGRLSPWAEDRLALRLLAAYADTIGDSPTRRHMPAQHVDWTYPVRRWLQSLPGCPYIPDKTIRRNAKMFQRMPRVFEGQEVRVSPKP